MAVKRKNALCLVCRLYFWGYVQLITTAVSKTTAGKKAPFTSRSSTVGLKCFLLSREAIQQLITRRIGTDNFLDRIHHIYKTEYYTQASKAPEIQTLSAEEVYFDHEFTKLFKKLEAAVSGAMEGGSGTDSCQLASIPVASAQNQDSVIASYKELIKEQDEELGKVRGKCGELETNYTQAEIRLQQQALEIQKLKDQLNNRYHREESAVHEDGNTNEDMESLRHAVASMKHDLNNCRQEIHDKEDRIKHLERELEVSQASLAVANAASILSEEDASRRKSHEFTDQELNELQQSKMALSSLQEEIQTLRAQNSTLRAELASQTQTGDSDILVKSLERKVDELLKSIREVREEKDNIAREQDDLLVLLSDQDAKCKIYRKRLKELGGNLSDDDEDDDDDSEEAESAEEESAGEEAGNVESSTEEKLEVSGDLNKDKTEDLSKGQDETESNSQEYIGTIDINRSGEDAANDLIKNGTAEIDSPEKRPGDEFRGLLGIERVVLEHSAETQE